MECREGVVRYLSWGFIISAAGIVFRQWRLQSGCLYGRYLDAGPLPGGRTCPAKLAWFLQELPAFLVPLLLLVTTETRPGLGKDLLLGTFCLHYFQRTFIYAALTKGRPVPLLLVACAILFCAANGFLQGHFLLHCAKYDDTRLTDVRLVTGLLVFFLGMAINIHSDHILRNLRRPGETVYRIPQGGMFEYVSGANFLGEILEWSGYAIATWSLPTFSFAFSTIGNIAPRAYHHHRYYKQKFEDYPRTRKAIIPFIL